jgi:hypothetical protein
VMNIDISVECEMFRFNSKQQWVNKAQSWFRECGVRRGHYICLDSIGRVCEKGLEFSRAETENTYPIVVYKLNGLG